MKSDFKLNYFGNNVSDEKVSCKTFYLFCHIKSNLPILWLYGNYKFINIFTGF